MFGKNSSIRKIIFYTGLLLLTGTTVFAKASIDVAGLSVGSELKLTWLRERIAAMRQYSNNPSLLIMVGGPLFSADPSRVQWVGADLTSDAASAPRAAHKLMTDRARARKPTDGYGSPQEFDA